MKPIFRILLLASLIVVAIPSIAQESRLQIVASHSIIGDVLRNVAGDVADITVTMDVGTDPHSFQPVPSDLVAITNADVVFINGAFFEEGLLEAIENAGSEMNIVTVSSCVEMLPFNGETHQHGEGEEHDDHEEHQLDDSDHVCEQHYEELELLEDEHGDIETLGMLYAIDCDDGNCDPHVWLRPENVMLWTLFIRDTLSELDPSHADTYAENAASYVLELEQLAYDVIMPMIQTVPDERHLLVTSHDSLGYFAAYYDFEIVSTIIPGGSTLAEPSTADIITIIDLIRETGAPAIFTETTVNDAVARQIASETGAEIRVLYSGSLSDQNELAGTYLDYMRYNVTTIVEALGGND